MVVSFIHVLAPNNHSHCRTEFHCMNVVQCIHLPLMNLGFALVITDSVSMNILVHICWVYT